MNRKQPIATIVIALVVLALLSGVAAGQRSSASSKSGVKLQGC